MTVDDVPVEIYDLLCQLGLTANYTGFFHTAYAVHLASAVERNIRASVTRIWRENPDRLRQTVGGALDRKPSNTVFLAGLAARLRRPPVP